MPLKIETESHSLQIRQIYAGHQADSAEILRRNHHGDADQWRIEPPRGSLLPFFSKMGWHPSSWLGLVGAFSAGNSLEGVQVTRVEVDAANAKISLNLQLRIHYKGRPGGLEVGGGFVCVKDFSKFRGPLVSAMICTSVALDSEGDLEPRIRRLVFAYPATIVPLPFLQKLLEPRATAANPLDSCIEKSVLHFRIPVNAMRHVV